MAFEPVRLAEDYDLFLAHLPLTQDLIQLSAIRGWKERCKRSLCWIDEEYAANLGAYKNWFSALDAFDHVVVGLGGTARALGEALNRTCHYVPGAVDAIRYSPYPGNPARVVDIYSVGRIREDVNEAFLAFSREKNWFYVHDTFLASHARVKDYRQHRQMHANMAKRSLYYHVAPAKMDDHPDSGGQIEVGFRYYEAAAAGTILVGQVPDCETFHTTFNWPDAVIHIREDGSDVPEVLSRLSADPKRLGEISRRNAAESLLRHDWVYRWKRIFEIAGLGETEGMKQREGRLREMARRLGDAQP
jgi:spore maturation protein CgeB